MPNRSKINDPRFWKKWRESGAVADFNQQKSSYEKVIECTKCLWTKRIIKEVVKEQSSWGALTTLIAIGIQKPNPDTCPECGSPTTPSTKKLP